MPNFKKGKSFADNFNAKSPFRSSISEFMAMGKALGSSKSSPPTAVDFTEHYKAPEKKAEEKPESASKILKNKKAQIELDKMDAKRALEEKATQPTGERKSVKKTDLTKAMSVDNSKKSGEWGTDINYGKNLSSAFPMKYGRKK